MIQITIENELYPRWGKQSMKLSRVLGSVGVVSAAALALVACGKSSNNNAGAKDAKKFKETTPVKAVKKGGTLSYAEETDTPLKKLTHHLQVFLTMNCLQAQLTVM